MRATFYDSNHTTPTLVAFFPPRIEASTDLTQGAVSSSLTGHNIHQNVAGNLRDRHIQNIQNAREEEAQHRYQVNDEQ